MKQNSAERLNAIANHPAVKPSLGYNDDYTDFTPLLAHPEAYVLLERDGFGAVFEWSAPGVWQAHTMALPEVRGKQAVNAARAMVDYMFNERGARMLWGMTPKGHRPARVFNRAIGAKDAGEGEDARGVTVSLYTVER